LRVTCIGKLNIDMFYPVCKIEINENHVSEDMDISIGGKGTNVSVALSKLGIESHMIASVGKDEFGSFAHKKNYCNFLLHPISLSQLRKKRARA